MGLSAAAMAFEAVATASKAVRDFGSPKDFLQRTNSGPDAGQVPRDKRRSAPLGAAKNLDSLDLQPSVAGQRRTTRARARLTTRRGSLTGTHSVPWGLLEATALHDAGEASFPSLVLGNTADAAGSAARQTPSKGRFPKSERVSTMSDSKLGLQSRLEERTRKLNEARRNHVYYSTAGIGAEGAAGLGTPLGKTPRTTRPATFRGRRGAVALGRQQALGVNAEALGTTWW